MGNTAEGIQGTGLAGIWQGGPNFSSYMQQMSRPNQLAAQKAYDNERKLRDDIISENVKFAPEKVWEPFYSEVEDEIQTNVREWTQGELARGLSPNQIQTERARRMGEARKLEKKINYFRSIHDGLYKRLNDEVDEGNLKPGYYDSKINDFFFNGRQAKRSDEIDPSGIENVFDDSAGYNMSKISSDFMRTLPQQVIEKYREISSQLGEQFDVNIVKSKLGLVTNPDGTPKIDPLTNLPVVSMTDDVVMAAMGNQYIRNYVHDQLGERASDTEAVKDLLAPLLTPFDKRAAQQQHRNGFKYTETQRNINSGGYTVPLNSVEERYDTLHTVTHERNPELLAAIGKAQGVKIEYLDSAEDNQGQFGGRPKSVILVEYPNPKWTLEREQGAGKNDAGQPKVPQHIRKQLPLYTEEQRQTAMEYLNTVFDEKLPAKAKIGENFTNFRKKKRREMEESESNSETGGVY